MSYRSKTSKNKRGSCLEVTVCLGLLQTTGSQLFTMSEQVAVVFCTFLRDCVLDCCDRRSTLPGLHPFYTNRSIYDF